jgi:hypothetical protein
MEANGSFFVLSRVSIDFIPFPHSVPDHNLLLIVIQSIACQQT